MEPEQRDDAQKDASNSLIIMICTLISRLLGIVKARAIASVFGATGVADVINFTFNIPNNFRKLFAEGALSSAYIPVFTSQLTQHEGKIDASGALLARMQAFQLIIMAPLILLTWLWRVQIVTFLSDFSRVEHLRLSGELLVYFMVFLGTISFASLYGGVLHSHRSFLTAAAAPLIFSLSVIVSVYTLSDRFGAYAMAFGAVVGGTLQALVTYLRLRQFGYRMRFSFRFSYGPFIRVMRSWAPVTLSASVAIITQQVAFYFASSLSEGAVTAYSNAIIIWQAPYGIFFSAIATVYFPAMVTAFHAKHRDQMGNLVQRGMISLAALLIPSALLLGALRHETIAVLLQSGNFTLQDTMLTAQVLLWFSIGMPIVAWYGFLQRVCFSMNRFTATLKVSIAVSVIDILVLSVGISSGYAVAVLSFANTVSFTIGTVILSIIAFRSGAFMIPSGTFIRSLIKLLVANLPLGFAVYLYHWLSPSWWHAGSTLSNASYLLVLGIIAAAITAASYRILHIDCIGMLKRRKR